MELLDEIIGIIIQYSGNYFCGIVCKKWIMIIKHMDSICNECNKITSLGDKKLWITANNNKICHTNPHDIDKYKIIHFTVKDNKLKIICNMFRSLNDDPYYKYIKLMFCNANVSETCITIISTTNKYMVRYTDYTYPNTFCYNNNKTAITVNLENLCDIFQELTDENHLSISVFKNFDIKRIHIKQSHIFEIKINTSDNIVKHTHYIPICPGIEHNTFKEYNITIVISIQEFFKLCNDTINVSNHVDVTMFRNAIKFTSSNTMVQTYDTHNAIVESSINKIDYNSAISKNTFDMEKLMEIAKHAITIYKDIRLYFSPNSMGIYLNKAGVSKIIMVLYPI